MTDISDRLWVLALSIWLVFMILFGGSGFPVQAVQWVQVGSSALILIYGLWRLRNGLPSGATLFGAGLAILAFALLFAQLWPIPFELWRTLPGREIMVKGLEVSGAIPTEMALSLSPAATKAAAVVLLSPLAAFIAALSVPRERYWHIAAAIVLSAFIGLAIGLLQKGMGAESGLFFYGNDGRGIWASGTFANKNFFAAQLYSALPIIGALAVAISSILNLRPFLILAFTFLFIGLVIAVLAAVGSRAGTILAMVSLLLTVLVVLRVSPRAKTTKSIGGGILAAVFGMVVMAQVSMVGILRLAGTDPINDFRNTISDVSIVAAKSQFPWGSGFGTFVPVYQLYETTETIIDPFVNYAHNEWLQLAIEGGAPAIALMGIFLLWLAYLLLNAFRLAPTEAPNAFIRASGIVVVLLLLHAIVDFPLRNAALLTMFGLCLGFLALATAAPRRKTSAPMKNQHPSRPITPRSPSPRTSTPARKHFGGKKPEPDVPAADLAQKGEPLA